VAVVCDSREGLGREMADRFGAQFVADPLEVAAHPLVEGIAVCTPEDQHLDPAIVALEHGKPVMVEKPLAHTIEAATSISRLSTGKGVPVLVGHILRFEPRYHAVRKAIEAGEIGPVQAVRSERIGLISDQQVLGGRTSIALYYGVHELDLCRWYAGEVTQVWAARSEGVLAAHGWQVEDLYSVGLRFRSGAHGIATIGWSLPASTPGYGMASFTVIGTHGMMQVRQGEVGISKVGQEGLLNEDIYYSPEVAGRLGGAIAIEADHFVQIVAGQAEPLCSAVDGAEAVRLALAMERAGASGKVVHL
jgi:predicted dehydrogenase